MSGFVVMDHILDDIMADICGAGSDYEECHCGRVVFNADHQGDDSNLPEVEELRRKAETEPDKYFEVDHSIPHIYLPWGEPAISVVIGCPCGLAVKVARQWIAHRSTIGNFFSAYATVVKNELAAQERATRQVSQPS